MAPAAVCAPTATARSIPTSAASGSKPGRALAACPSSKITSSTCRSPSIGSCRGPPRGSTSSAVETASPRRVGSPMPAPSRLAGLLRDGRFVVTAELTSTNSADPEATWRLADLLGAAALGVRNILLMSGDDVTAGDHPEARRIYDIDSMQLIEVAAGMRDRGVYLSGRKLEQAPSFFIGAVENPSAPPLDSRPRRLQRKVRRAPVFIQTRLSSTCRSSHASCRWWAT